MACDYLPYNPISSHVHAWIVVLMFGVERHIVKSKAQERKSSLLISSSGTGNSDFYSFTMKGELRRAFLLEEEKDIRGV